MKCGYCSREMTKGVDNKHTCSCGGTFDGVDRFDHDTKPTLFLGQGTTMQFNKLTQDWDYTIGIKGK